MMWCWCTQVAPQYSFAGGSHQVCPLDLVLKCLDVVLNQRSITILHPSKLKMIWKYLTKEVGPCPC